MPLLVHLFILAATAGVIYAKWRWKLSLLRGPGYALGAMSAIVLIRLFVSGGSPSSFPFVFILMLGAAGWGFAHVTDTTRKESLKGAALETDAQRFVRHGKALLAAERPSRFALGDVAVPLGMETRNLLLVGSPGSGKSQAITKILDAIYPVSKTSVIVDVSGIFCSRYYHPEAGHVIFNPFDARSVKWSPLAEIRSIADCPRIAKSIVPDGEGEGGEWNGHAQNFITQILEYCWSRNLTNGDFYELCIVASIYRLRIVCKGSAAAPLVADGNERMFGSVRGIVGRYVQALRYIDPAVGKNGFSVRRHIEEMRAGWIFVTYQQSQRDALKSLIAAVVDIAARAALELPPDHDRRVLFAIDEASLIGKVGALIDLLTNGRKHGVMALIGIQTNSQFQSIYGKYSAQTILACLAGKLILRCSDAETAEVFAKELGEHEYRRGSFSENLASGKSEFSGQSGEQIQRELVVMPTELMRLEDLNGFLVLPDSGPIRKIKLEYIPVKSVAAAYIPAADVLTPSVAAENVQSEGESSEGCADPDMPFDCGQEDAESGRTDKKDDSSISGPMDDLGL